MFDAQQVADEMIDAIADVLVAVEQRDRPLADQARRAAQSVALNLAEGRLRVGKDRLQHFRIAAGSVAEARAALRIAKAWRYADRVAIDVADGLLDRLAAMLWRLTHPR